MAESPPDTPPDTPSDPPPVAPDDQFDRDLVASIRDGDAAAWGSLIESYQVRIFSICIRMVRDRELASDLTQDAFIKIMKGLDTFDERARLSTWIYRVTVNVCLSKLRSEKLRRHASLEAMAASAGGRHTDGRNELGFAQHREPEAHLGIEHEEERQRMLAALGQLSDEHRAILTLRDGRGLEYEQIAEVLDIPVGTVRSRLFRARAALRLALEDNPGTPESN
ncbi:MAG: sigma-70 family RNA polymerase sigma factor [Planctomycetota bacterium]|nr:sigma-70 family RNA polymerase sigma factor [Planctomycetota bacterium]